MSTESIAGSLPYLSPSAETSAVRSCWTTFWLRSGNQTPEVSLKLKVKPGNPAFFKPTGPRLPRSKPMIRKASRCPAALAEDSALSITEKLNTPGAGSTWLQSTRVYIVEDGNRVSDIADL